MKQVFVRRGSVILDEVPPPAVEPGHVVVGVCHSCISTGTELAGVRASDRPLLAEALKQPGKVARFIESALAQGVPGALAALEARRGSATPTGYSAAGRILQVGAGIDDLAVGQMVAAAGAQCAHHAEIIRVPRNLVVPVPEGVSTADASTVALGAIALQGVRRAGPTLGETFAVIGLGTLGLLTVQLLAASGCQVVAIDLDARRVALAEALGAQVGLVGQAGGDDVRVARLTRGVGVDGAIVTAASSSDEVLATAFRMCRRKGRVVLVGDVGLGLRREDIYAKELDFLVSTSYGPGRYDARYEERGLDYPVAFVRWTENRNMAEYLALLARGRLDLRPLAPRTFPLAAVADAYTSLMDETAARPLLAILAYPSPDRVPDVGAVATRPDPGPRQGRVGLAVVGAGGFARAVHLPNVAALSDLVELRAVACRSGANAVGAARQFGAAAAATFDEILADATVQAVLIATRHDRHADMALAALEAGKHVYLEKPLAIHAGELERLRAFFAPGARPTAPPLLMTGFNRRFSPLARAAQRTLARRAGPLVATYRVNAGAVPAEHWVHGPEGGGRNLGEACHFYDLFLYLVGRPVVRMTALPAVSVTGRPLVTENFVASFAFEDGSLCTLVYSAAGSPRAPKEQLEILFDQQVMVLDDWRLLRIVGAADEPPVELPQQDKGHREALAAFLRAVRRGDASPIPVAEQLASARMALDVEDALRAGPAA